MALVLCNNGEGDMLSYAVNKSAPQSPVLRLFVNNITPSETDVAATYTEASFTGYAAITTAGADWTITEGAPSAAACVQETFTSTANQATQNVYGYFFTRVTSGRLWIAERFPDAPTPISNNGDTIKITPNFTLD
jgi:hypothetical protein